jgi:hypothetical protein
MGAAPMKIRLDKWLEKEFYPPPKIRTARLWITAGKIYPPPVKVGCSYYVEENATFADNRTRPPLADRITK